MELPKTLTIDKLNQCYVKLIKLVLNGSISSHSSLLNNFYTDPSPDQAFSLLNRILNPEISPNPTPTIPTTMPPQINSHSSLPTSHTGHTSHTVSSGHKKKQEFQVQYSQANGKRFQLRKAMTIGDERETNMRVNQDRRDVGTEKGRSEKHIADKIGEFENSGETKGDKLKRITSKLTQIFSNNNKKIMKYQQISKVSISNSTSLPSTNISSPQTTIPTQNDYKFAKPIETGYKKH